MGIYGVRFEKGQSLVYITLRGFETFEAKQFPEIGTFDLDIDPIDSTVKGDLTDSNEVPSDPNDHPFVSEAKKVLRDNDVDVDAGIGTKRGVKLEFRDQASNAAVLEADGSTKEEAPKKKSSKKK